jgi:ribose-phosphate pyrophosphokinase
VRGEDVFILQSTSYPTNDNLMELLIMIDALRAPRRGASRRSSPISAMPGRTAAGPAHADLGQAGRQPDHRAGADRVLTLDLHAGQIQGFFDIPTDNLFAVPVMARDIKAKYEQLQRHGRLAGRRRRGARPRAGQAPRCASSPSSTSAASAPANPKS